MIAGFLESLHFTSLRRELSLKIGGPEQLSAVLIVAPFAAAMSAKSLSLWGYFMQQGTCAPFVRTLTRYLQPPFFSQTDLTCREESSSSSNVSTGSISFLSFHLVDHFPSFERDAVRALSALQLLGFLAAARAKPGIRKRAVEQPVEQNVP